MRVFVSGATGFIGIQLVKRLSEAGHQVHALYRSESKKQLIDFPGVLPFKGDILDRASLERAMEGCVQAYHAAAFAAVWLRDPSEIYRMNIDGSLLLIDVARETGVRRVVITSTAGILGPSQGEEVNEDSPVPESFFTDYEASKQKLEEAIRERKQAEPELILVNPTRVYGPGYMSVSNGVTRMLIQYYQGKWRFIPGKGDQTGNYIHVEDVVTGHLLAMEKGRPGERYILGGENISYQELFDIFRAESGVNKGLYHLPLGLMLGVSKIMLGFAELSGRPPLIVPGLVQKFNHHWKVSSEKAARELGYSPRTAQEGLANTFEWIRNGAI